MVRKKTTKKIPSKKEVKGYVHSQTKRTNNPPVGLAKQEQHSQEQQKYSFDPRLDPQLYWSGKQENTSFEIDTVSIHVHERIDPSTILEKVKRTSSSKTMTEFFDTDENNPPLYKALDFYEHEQGWSNRMIAGDSLLVMNSLLIKENMRNKVQMIYFDPPYGIKYGSNFQPFVNQHSVQDGKDEYLTSEPEMIKAFRDTWELGIHSYLTHIRERCLFARELLTESGSMFIQISDENIHLVRTIMDEIFGPKNFISLITWRRKTNSMGAKLMASVSNYIIWYAKDKEKIKYHKLFEERDPELGGVWSWAELPDGTRRKLTKQEIEKPKSIPHTSKIFRLYDLAPSSFSGQYTFNVMYKGKEYGPPYRSGGRSWKHNKEGIKKLIEKNRVEPSKNTLNFIAYWDDFPYNTLDNQWDKQLISTNKKYVVETSPKGIMQCMLMCTDPGDLVLDITCGSGTTAYVAEKYGRRWITCDTSRVALNLAQRRLMTSVYDYYELVNSKEGVCGGFKYNTVTNITPGSLANDEPPKQETLYDKPHIDRSKHRISGPFTVEAIPSPVGKSIDVLHEEFENMSDHISYQKEWRDELLHTGIRTRNNKRLEFTDISTSKETKWIHAVANTREDNPQVSVVSFGPPHGPLTTVQVSNVLDEVEHIRPKPTIVIFAAMQFDPEASKIIKETKWKGVTILKVDMNKDLLVSDLKKKQRDSESFWEVGRPDCTLIKNNGKYIVKVNGFDYYDTSTNKIVSGDTSKISMWMLDTDYNGLSLYPEQVFFTKTVGNQNNEMKKLAKTLNRSDDIIDESLIEQYTGTESLPFVPGEHKRIAIKIIDDRGISTLDTIDVE